MSRFLHPRFAQMEPYAPGEQPKDRSYIKLNTNESPYPPSPQVLAALGRQDMEALRLYSDPEGLSLRKKLSACYGVAIDQVFLSNGSDDILNFAFLAFGAKGASFPDITYSFYPVFCALHGVAYTQIPLGEDFSVRPNDYNHSDGMVVLANPNAPTGMALSLGQIRGVLEQNPERLVLIDEAYVDFGAESAVPLLQEFDNLLVVMTYSKSRAMAGVRLGFALGSPAIIADLEKIKYATNPYNVNSLSMKLAEAAVDSQDYFDECCKKIVATREETVIKLKEYGFEVLPSQANFVFVRHPKLDGETLYRRLREEGILIRHFTKAAICQYNRITIGRPEEMQALLAVIGRMLKREVV